MFVDQKVADRLLQVGTEATLLGVGLRKEAAGKDRRLEEPLRQILDFGGVSRRRRDERADGGVIPLGKLIQGGRRVVAVP
jgi:hypothetical protein